MERLTDNKNDDNDSFGWIKFQEEFGSQENQIVSEVEPSAKNMSSMLNEVFGNAIYGHVLEDCNLKEMGELIGYTLIYAQIFWNRPDISNCPQEHRDDMVRESAGFIERLKEEDDSSERKKLFCRGIITKLREQNPDNWDLLDPFDLKYSQADDPSFNDDEEIYTEVAKSLFINGFAYHGFNSGIESSIKENGLSTETRATDAAEISELDRFVAKYNPEGYLGFGYLSNAAHGWRDYSKNAIFYTTNPAMAYEYASTGPEWLSYFIDDKRKDKEEDGPYKMRDYEGARKVMENWCDRMMGLEISEGIPPRVTWMNDEERGRVMDFFERQWATYGNGEPRIAMFSNRLVGREEIPNFLSYEEAMGETLSKKIANLINYMNMGTNYKTRTDIPPKAIQIINLPIYQKTELFKKKKEYQTILDHEYGYSSYGEVSVVNNEMIKLAESDAIFRSLLNAGERRYFSTHREERKKIAENFYDGYNRNANFTGIVDLSDKPTRFREFIDEYYDYFDRLDDIDDSLMDERLKGALATSLVYSDYPEKRIKQLLTILSRKDIPTVAKEYMTFETISPIEETRGGINRDEDSVYFNAKSPVLCSAIYESDGSVKESAFSANAEHRQIIFADLLKCALWSDGTEMKHFISNLKDNETILNAVANSNGDLSNFSDDEIKASAQLVSQCDALYHQMQIGQDKPWDLSADLYQAVRQTIDRFKPTKRYGLADRIVRCFCYPLGISSADDALSYIEENQKWANTVHGSASIWGEFEDGERVFELQDGDLVKSIKGGPLTLAGILKNGILAYNYVGDGAGLLHRDFSQLDTDFAMISNQQGNFFEKIQQSSAGDFLNRPGSEIVLMVHPYESMFQWTEAVEHEKRTQEYGGWRYIFKNYTNVQANPKQYEIYRVGVMSKHGGDDYGVRTGLPSSEISCIMAGEDVVDDVKELVKHNSFYIPVVDKDGKLLLSFDEYKRG